MMKLFTLLLIISTQIFAKGYISEATCSGVDADNQKLKLSFQLEEDYFCSDKDVYDGAVITIYQDDGFDDLELMTTKVEIEELSDEQENVVFTYQEKVDQDTVSLKAYYNFETAKGHFSIKQNNQVVEEMELQCDIIMLHIDC